MIRSKQDVVRDFAPLGIQLPDLPDLCGQFSGRLLLVGAGRCVWDDVEAAGMAKNEDMPVMAINQMGIHWPTPLLHLYSNDSKVLAHVPDLRMQYRRGQERIRYIHSMGAGGKYRWPWPGHGTSALNAAYTALALGYDEVWMCGIPLDNSGHYFDPPWMATNFANEVADRGGSPRYWVNAARHIFKGRVKSFSGRTRELLGAPQR